MTNVIHVNFRNRRPIVLDDRTAALLELDRELSSAEQSYCTAHYHLTHSRGPERKRRMAECEELGRQIVALERARLRLCGPELALLPGGRT